MTLTKEDLFEIKTLLQDNNQILKLEIKEEILPVVQKMIDDALAEQTELLFKHFVTKDEFNFAIEQVKNIKLVVSDHSFRIQVLENKSL